ncbi:carbohydrate ABC transporter permease [Clostridium tagluense]|uniref:carbohydrate ABC transporter permease n=1 Tax=Clostridium tagluense TaxID=360422 RepID=UPI001C6DEDD2|nr:carbohydrate ABC transporter permease [Clostridium tagluense]MBW9156845.1 carbohydrate ABC transporter permease [Clostridium tagluense]MCB2311495.1 carbohydrate ABC transporter permease [Clostridium tagluense]MCB2316219.1 carbohydrate ABC transporter permease [Clostridium tagluense]MCB2320977.1 carbohydrate ABC transporter permease [Clostridium tagluense]MCB2325994.1 carbohydrate ABC transporter permease [Clostridium tagluense]
MKPIKLQKKKVSLVSILFYFILIVGTTWVLLPFIWMLLTAVKPANEVMSMPPKWIPSKFMWENFKEALVTVPFQRYLFNSILVAVCVTLGELFTTILASYAFSYIPFRYKNILFIILVATMMVPSEILMIPNYVTLSNFGWINSYKALIFPWCASIFSIFLLRQQFSTVPYSYYKSAKMDGCSDFRYLFTILVPLSMPTLVSIAILKFINSWNSYMWPLITTNTKEMRTLPVALAAFSSEAGTRYNVLMAFSVMMVAPVIILYLFTQKHIIKGISKSGLKG